MSSFSQLVGFLFFGSCLFSSVFPFPVALCILVVKRRFINVLVCMYMCVYRNVKCIGWSISRKVGYGMVIMINSREGPTVIVGGRHFKFAQSQGHHPKGESHFKVISRAHKWIMVNQGRSNLARLGWNFVQIDVNIN